MSNSCSMSIQVTMYIHINIWTKILIRHMFMLYLFSWKFVLPNLLYPNKPECLSYTMQIFVSLHQVPCLFQINTTLKWKSHKEMLFSVINNILSKKKHNTKLICASVNLYRVTKVYKSYYIHPHFETFQHKRGWLYPKSEPSLHWQETSPNSIQLHTNTHMDVGTIITHNLGIFSFITGAMLNM